VLREGGTATGRQLREHVNAQLSPCHAPAEIGFYERLPLNTVGKPDRATLLAQAREPGSP